MTSTKPRFKKTVLFLLFGTNSRLFFGKVLKNLLLLWLAFRPKLSGIHNSNSESIRLGFLLTKPQIYLSKIRLMVCSYQKRIMLIILQKSPTIH